MSASKELRLATVCYGGVSLAVYMHGITLELHNLVLASAAYERNRERNPFAADTTRAVYWELLREVETRGDLQLRVVVDVIAGTSAGGINGIFLAKALSENRSQGSLRNLWFERADIKQLAGGKLAITGKLLKAIGAALLPKVKSKPPLRGNAMIDWLYDALSDMPRWQASELPAEVAALDSLVAPHQDLDLFVTTTDQPGFRREIPIDVPPLVAERRHRHVLHFEHARGEFASAFDSVLTFAARATSSFPGAFPQVNPRQLIARLRGRATSPAATDFLSDDFRQQHDFFRQYTVEDADPGAALFVDGGVLDNFPFGPVVSTIAARRAGRQVDRRLLYIQPDPRSDLAPAAEQPDSDPEAKGLFGTALDGLSSLPSHEPIVDDLQRVFRLNRMSARLRTIVAQNEQSVRDLLEEALRGVDIDLDGDWLAQLSTRSAANGDRQRRIATLRQAIDHTVGASTGIGHRPYVQARAQAVIDQFVADILRLLGYPEGSTPALAVGAIVHRWAESRGWLGEQATSVAQQQLLTTFDLGRLRRRVRFVVQAINDLYKLPPSASAVPRASLDAAKRELYAILDEIEGVIDGAGLPEPLRQDLQRVFRRRDLIGGVRAAEAEPLSRITERLLAQRRQALDNMAETLSGHLVARRDAIRRRLFRSFERLTVTWAPAARRPVLERYLGFPFWDLLIYPVVVHGATDRQDPIEIVRLSPQEESSLAPPGWDQRLDTLVAAKLRGLGKAHFQAFFKRQYRENDYLWGRLDGFAGLLALVLDSAGLSEDDTKDDDSARKEAVALRLMGQRAVLAEEAESLTTRASRRLLARLRDLVA